MDGFFFRFFSSHKKWTNDGDLKQILFNVYHTSTPCSLDLLTWVGHGEKYKQPTGLRWCKRDHFCGWGRTDKCGMCDSQGRQGARRETGLYTPVETNIKRTQLWTNAAVFTCTWEQNKKNKHCFCSTWWILHVATSRTWNPTFACAEGELPGCNGHRQTDWH